MEEKSVRQCKEWWEDKVANNYFTKYAFHFSQPQLIEKFKLGKDSFVLEIGAGYGRETSQFCKISDNVYAIDISKSALKLIQENAPIAIVSEFDGYKLDFSDEIFDLVYSCFVIQHIEKKQAKNLIVESARVLKPTGRILFEFFDNLIFNAGTGKDAYSGNKETGMYNNGYTEGEIFNFIDKIEGIEVDWIYTVDHGILGNEKFKTYNHWLCMKKKISMNENSVS